ncbi:MAG: cyclic nucleotide-binding domain-containing protein [Rhodoferax sp.]|nr:cyclic nucleotide-binding domain-containing protein [Rhodoferax sp.]
MRGDATFDQQLQAAGLELLGTCVQLSLHIPQWTSPAPLLEDLTPDEIDALGLLMPKVGACAGQTLIAEGDTGDWMLLLLHGTVDVFKKTQDGRASRLAVVRQGAAVGEMSMFDAAPRYASCVALEEVRAGVLTRQLIAQLIHEHPAIGAKLMVKLTQLMAQRLRNTSNQLVKLLREQQVHL